MPVGLLAIPSTGLQIVIASNQTDYDLAVALGSPSFPVAVTVIIDASVTIDSSGYAVPSFSATGLARMLGTTRVRGLAQAAVVRVRSLAPAASTCSLRPR